MIDIQKIADAADMIVNGYSFTRDEKGYRVLNLNHPEHAAVIAQDGEMLETTMDDIEIQIMLDSFFANKRFLEEDDAEVL